MTALDWRAVTDVYFDAPRMVEAHVAGNWDLFWRVYQAYPHEELVPVLVQMLARSIPDDPMEIQAWSARQAVETQAAKKAKRNRRPRRSRGSCTSSSTRSGATNRRSARRP